MIAYFSHPYAFNRLHLLTWDVVTSISVFECSFNGTLAKVDVAGSDPISYKQNKMDVYRQDLKGLLQDVTQGTFVDSDSLTPIAGQATRGYFYSAGDALSDILHCQQSKVNQDIAPDKISGPSNGIDVIAAPLL